MEDTFSITNSARDTNETVYGPNVRSKKLCLKIKIENEGDEECYIATLKYNYFFGTGLEEVDKYTST